MGEDTIAQVVSGGFGIGLVTIAIRQLGPILEMNRQAAIGWKKERVELHDRIDALESRVTVAEDRADAAVRKSDVAVLRAEECEARERELRKDLAMLREQTSDG